MKSVIVIGAGIAGLHAANLLSKKFTVTILEAASFAGGRIRSYNENGITTEGGAEFIHGSQQITMGLAYEAGLKWIAGDDTMLRNRGNGPEQVIEMTEDFDELLRRMKSAEDIRLDEFLQKSGLSPVTIREATMLSRSFSLANPEEVSVRYLSEDWASLEEEQCFLSGGYNTITNHLHQKCTANNVTFRFNCRAEKVEWAPGFAKVYTTEGLLEANIVIITVPVSRLVTTPGIEINFNEEIKHALGCFGFGPTIKVILEFNEKFWPDAGFFISEETFATWWTHPEYTNRLTGWMDEKNARDAVNDSDWILEKAIQSISAILSIPQLIISQHLRRHHIYNWQSGAYSYGKPGFAEARKLLSAPIDETIFLAGEAFQDKVPGATVEAALESAENLAKLFNVNKSY